MRNDQTGCEGCMVIIAMCFVIGIIIYLTAVDRITLYVSATPTQIPFSQAIEMTLTAEIPTDTPTLTWTPAPSLTPTSTATNYSDSDLQTAIPLTKTAIYQKQPAR